jgi:hypothetical protein
MRFRRLLGAAGVFLVFQCAAFSQGNVQTQTPIPAIPPIQGPTNFVVNPWSEYPAPSAPLELVTSGAEPVQTAEERANALDLLAKAQRLSTVRAQPYDLKTSFTTYGSLPSDGQWTLEDIGPGPGIYRWTAEGPGFSGTFLYTNRFMLSSNKTGALPLRLMQVRNAIFGVYGPLGPRQAMRIAMSDLNGGAVECLLAGPDFSFGRGAEPALPPGHNYQEQEYCVNTEAGLLETYSPVAGIYIRYDYGNAIHFHDHIVPVGFTIYEKGRVVVEAKTDNVADPPSANSEMFQPGRMNSIGAGAVIAPTVHSWRGGSAPDAPITSPQLVVLQGSPSPDGQLNEVEIVSTTDERLNNAAIQDASRPGPMGMIQNDQPGATAQSRVIIIVERFLPLPLCSELPVAFGSGPAMGRAPCRPSN